MTGVFRASEESLWPDGQTMCARQPISSRTGITSMEKQRVSTENHSNPSGGCLVITKYFVRSWFHRKKRRRLSVAKGFATYISETLPCVRCGASRVSELWKAKPKRQGVERLQRRSAFRPRPVLRSGSAQRPLHTESCLSRKLGNRQQSTHNGRWAPISRLTGVDSQRPKADTEDSTAVGQKQIYNKPGLNYRFHHRADLTGAGFVGGTRLHCGHSSGCA